MSPFGTRIRWTFDFICQQIFCLDNFADGAGAEIMISGPFNIIEKSLRDGLGLIKYNPRDVFEGLSDYSTIPPSPREPPQLERHKETRPISVSQDLFLLNFGDLNLDGFFTNARRAGNLYLSADKFYPCVFEHLQKVILEDHGNMKYISTHHNQMLSDYSNTE